MRDLNINRELILGVYASIDEFFTSIGLPLSTEQRAALHESAEHMGTYPVDGAA